MAHILVRSTVEDYGKWKSEFDKHVGVRKSSGSKGGHVFRSADNPNEVLVLLEWDSLANARQFAQSDDLRERMQQAGVMGPPDVYFLDVADKPAA